MNTFVNLLKREYLEHYGAFLWSPVVVLALIVIFGLMFAGGSGSLDFEMADGENSSSIQIEAEGDDDALGRALTALVFDVAGTTDAELSERMAGLMNLIPIPFYWVWVIVSLFGLIACLHDERKDRSVLFWKSMPVGDMQTVASKYAFLAWVAPMLTLSVILVAQLFVTFLLVGLVEDGMGMRLLMHSGIVMSFLQIFVGFIVNGFVVLPVFAWFILVSGWAKSMPMVWAFAVPFWLIVLESIVIDSDRIASFVAYHLSMPSLPGTSSDGEEPFINVSVTSFAEQLTVLGQAQFWLGLVIGLCFLAGAVYLRRVRNEI
ncbi:MAG: hypothetical protein GKR90_09240 [Pseudomonadales bacterium]|nr:hypothetical protein [Pseudomonadales bacterium]